MEKILSFFEKIREKPEMYFKSPSFSQFLNVFNAYELIALTEVEVDIPSACFLLELGQYICNYYNLHGVRRAHLLAIHLFTETEEAAFHKFFELLDEFIASKEGGFDYKSEDFLRMTLVNHEGGSTLLNFLREDLDAEEKQSLPCNKHNSTE